ncbi:hypothetical protein DY000_02005182 [Brassica cretica]|uniref:Uncharacterized protein n=1 Tax=Brassica cretica TaxID=69181 RepID=A0ABQ7C3B6_BRACR|nr:hypothetical protein DY000_02005182 [Brassica cretica]
MSSLDHVSGDASHSSNSFSTSSSDLTKDGQFKVEEQEEAWFLPPKTELYLFKKMLTRPLWT